MTNYINCIAHNSSEGNLLIGDTATALFDCGVGFCADDTIAKVKSALNGRDLDYIFGSHTHYDHIGALPYFRAAFPNVKYVTNEVGAATLQKDTPRRVIREMSKVAILDYGGGKPFVDYNDNAFCADVVVAEGDVIDLGGVSVEIIETPGHTRDSLSFFVPELELLILSETTGVLLDDNEMYTSCLTGFHAALAAVEKCRKFPHKFLSLPHRGVVDGDSATKYFELAEATITECRDFILEMYAEKLGESEMLERFFERYSSPTLQQYQTRVAFDANAWASIYCAIRESGE